MCKCKTIKTIAICLIHWPHELYVMPQVRCTYGGGCRVGAGGGGGIVSGKGFAAGGDAGSTGCDAQPGMLLSASDRAARSPRAGIPAQAIPVEESIPRHQRTMNFVCIPSDAAGRSYGGVHVCTY